jgi:hypothetical protein
LPLIRIDSGYLARYVVQSFDWFYFKLALIASIMYLFDLIAIGTVPARLMIASSGVYSDFLNFPVLTLVYLWTLFDFFGLKLFVHALSARHKRKIPE